MARKVVIKSIKNLLQYRSKLNPEAVGKDFIESLAEEGRRIIMLAYASRGFNDRTKNLKDSYVSAVFKDGELIEDSIRFLNRDPKEQDATRAHTSGLWGREEAMYFLRDVKDRQPKEGYSLVIGVGMFYGSILEKKWGYRVLANAYTELEALKTRGIKSRKYLTYYSLDGKEKTYIYRVDSKRS